MRLAIIGAGVIGRTHAEVATQLAELEVVAIADPHPDRAAALVDQLTTGGQPAPATFDDLDTLLATIGDQVDLVSICTPSGSHAALARQALAAGHHVVVEKPVDTRIGPARALLEESAARPEQVVAVISQHRHDASSVAIHRAIEAGRFGRITSATASVDWYRTQGYYEAGDWRGTWADDGGALMNQGIHTLDLLLWFLGEPVDVSAQFAQLGHTGVEVEDVAVAIVRFASGALATVHASTTVYPDLGVRLQVHGTDGSAVIEGDKLAFFHSRDAESGDWLANQAAAEVAEVADPGALRGSLDPAGSHASQYGNAHLTQFADVIAAIRSGGRPRVGVPEALLALATVRSIYLSATLGRPIRVADVLAGEHDDLTPRLSQSAVDDRSTKDA